MIRILPSDTVERLPQSLRQTWHFISGDFAQLEDSTEYTQLTQLGRKEARVVVANTATPPELVTMLPDAMAELRKDTQRGIATRGSTKSVALRDGSAARLRMYRRGGLLRYCNSDVFWGQLSTSRLLRELQILDFLTQREIPVVEPLGGYFERVAIGFYRCLIATKEVKEAATLLAYWQSASATEELVVQHSQEVAHSVRRMIALGVHHCDLYPGNVLRDAEGELTIIDFDKASLHCWESGDEGQRCKLQSAYLKRWTRGCNKHLSALQAKSAITAFKNELEAEGDA